MFLLVLDTEGEGEITSHLLPLSIVLIDQQRTLFFIEYLSHIFSLLNIIN